jgi:two-component sensor histidine kinase
MFIAEDVTEIESLEKEMKDQKDASSKKTTILQELSQSPKDDLSLFFTNSYNLIEEAVEKAKVIRTNTVGTNKSEYEILFRNLHTLKGNSRVFSLGFISTIVHDVETDGLELKEVIQTLDEKIQNSSINEFIQKLYGIQGQINEYIKIGKEVFNFEFEDDKKIKGNLNDLFMNFEFCLSDILPRGLNEFNKDDTSDGEKTIQPLSNDLYYQISINLHSQKGLAKSIGEKDISSSLHTLEGIFEEIKNDPKKISTLSDELFTNINSIHCSVLKLCIQSSIFLPIDLDNEHFVIYLERFFNFTRYILGGTEEQIDVGGNSDIYSMYTYGNNNQIKYLSFLTKKIMSITDKGQILFYLKSLWEYTSLIVSLDMIKHSNNEQREKLEDGFPQNKEIYSELHSLFLVKFLNLYSKEDIVKTFEQLLGDTFNFKDYFIPPKSSSKIINETFLTLKNNPTFSMLEEILVASKRDGKDFILEKMKRVIQEKSVFFHAKILDVLEILFFYSDLGSERDALSGPQLVEVIKENYSKFYEKFKSLIERDKTEEALVVGKYFRDLLDLPVKYSFNRFRTVVSEVSKSLGKKINFKLSGDQCSLSKESLNLLHDAMVHLVRNSLDHGIEAPEIRSQNNKDVEGTLEIKCSHLGEDKIIIVLQDDGGGINPEIISEKIVSKGLKTEEEVSKMSIEEILNLIFLPGFSTKEQATEISGRGVGMDVVKQNLKIIGAEVKVESEVKKGTKFIIEIDKNYHKIG